MTLNNLPHYKDHQELDVIMSLDLMLPSLLWLWNSVSDILWRLPLPSEAIGVSSWGIGPVEIKYF